MGWGCRLWTLACGALRTFSPLNDSSRANCSAPSVRYPAASASGPTRQTAARPSASRAYGEALTQQIENAARGYRHKWRRNELVRPTNDPARKKGDAIREMIAANAKRRFAIAEAMKREAGVKAHDINAENAGGLAWNHTGKILAPAGETIAQLYTIAHECGHVFLHSAGTPGYMLPTHVKELEAESYAHQAFRVYGLQVPKKRSEGARRYVASWIAADRADGVSIDQRAEAYVNGSRSPFEPLRAVPDAWRRARVFGLQLPPEPAELVHPAKPGLVVVAVTGFIDNPHVQTEPVTFWRKQWALVKRDAKSLTLYLGINAVVGFYAAYFASKFQFGDPANQYYGNFGAVISSAVIGMLIWLCGAMMLRTATAGPAVRLPAGVVIGLPFAIYHAPKRIYHRLKTRMYRRRADNPHAAACLAYPIRPLWLERIATASKLFLFLAVALACGFVAVRVMADPQDTVGHVCIVVVAWTFILSCRAIEWINYAKTATNSGFACRALRACGLLR